MTIRVETRFLDRKIRSRQVTAGEVFRYNGRESQVEGEKRFIHIYTDTVHILENDVVVYRRDSRRMNLSGVYASEEPERYSKVYVNDAGINTVSLQSRIPGVTRSLKWSPAFSENN